MKVIGIVCILILITLQAIPSLFHPLCPLTPSFSLSSPSLPFSLSPLPLQFSPPFPLLPFPLLPFPPLISPSSVLQILWKVDTILFCLLVLRGLSDSKGRVWRCHPTQLYAIEVTLPEQPEQQVCWVAGVCVHYYVPHYSLVGKWVEYKGTQ